MVALKNTINEKIEYIAASENPLSSDVIFIYGDNATWIFDVGANDESFEAISDVILKEDGKDVNIIISHFHRDHMSNLDRVMNVTATNKKINLYVSRYTSKRSNCGIIVEDDIRVDDGVKIHIFPVASTHSKGCLCLAVDDEAVFVGDLIYPAYKTIEDISGGEMSPGSVDKFDTRNEYREQHKVYNVQHLKEQIDKLKTIDVKKVFLAHEKHPLIRKLVIEKFLESVYLKREQGNPYIIQ